MVVQLGIGVQLVHTRSVVAVQAAVICWPAGQAPEHATQLLPER